MTDAAAETPMLDADEAPREPLFLPQRAGDRLWLAALVGSLLLHALPLASLVALLAFDTDNARERQRLGDEAGKLDGVNVELIDAKEYDRRYLSHTAGSGTGSADAPPPQEAAKPVQQPKSEEPKPEAAKPEPPKPEVPKPEAAKPEPPKAEAEPAKPEPPKPEPAKPAPPEPAPLPAPEAQQQTEPPKPTPEKVEPPKPEPPKPEQPKPEPAKPEPATPEPRAESKPSEVLTQAEADQLVRTAEAQFKSIADASSRASLAAKGTSSPAIRAILRRLKSAMPRSSGARGFLVVRIILTPTGGVGSVKVVVGSGTADLDNRVVASVHGALAPDPSVHLKPEERLLQITYEYF